MSSVWLVLRAGTRAHWRRYSALALLIALFGAAILTIVEGAHRTSSVFDRFSTRDVHPDVIIPNVPDPSGRTASFSPDAVSRLPEVRHMEVTNALPLIVHRKPAFGVAGQNPRLGASVFPVTITSGRNLDARHADEAILAYQSAKRLGLEVGDRFPLRLQQPVRAIVTSSHAQIPAVMRVVGIYLVPTEFPPSTTATDFHFSRALFDELPPNPTPSIVLALRHGARDVSRFKAELAALSSGKAVETIEPSSEGPRNGQRSVALQAGALWVLGAAVALIAMLILAQVVARHLAVEARDSATLRALGMTRKRLWVLGLCGVAGIATVAALAAAVLAYALSWVWPIGTAGLAEPTPGFSFDALVLVGGGGALVIVILALAAWPAWRATRVTSAGDVKPPATLPTALASRVRLPLAGLLGARFALQRGRGPSAVPVGTTIGAAVVALMGLTGALVFGSSLSELLDTPRLYGVTWNLTLQSDRSDLRTKAATIKRDPGVDGLAFGVAGLRLEVEHRQVDAAAFDRPVLGAVAAPILEGRRPVATDDIALGARTFSDFGVRLGSRLVVEFPGGATARMRLVGRVVVPPAAVAEGPQQHTNTQGFGEGALVTYAALRKHAPTAAPRASAFIALRPGSDPRSGAERLVAELGPGTSQPALQSPNDLFNFGRIRNLPIILAVVVALLGIGALAHMLASTVRRRAHDIALLKALGMSRASVSKVVAWQATLLALVSLLIGVPLGVAAGRIGWNLFADRQGVVAQPEVVYTTLVVVIATTLIIANVIALLPGRRAARLRPAVTLRSE